MKRIIFLTLILLLIGTAVYAQQRQTSVEIRQNAQELLAQTRANNDEFEDALAEIRYRNGNNSDYSNYQRIRAELDHLETMINRERATLGIRLDRGNNVSTEVMERFERMVNRHRALMLELEQFIGG